MLCAESDEDMKTSDSTAESKQTWSLLQPSSFAFWEEAGKGSYWSGRQVEHCIHLFAAGSLVPACPLPAYLLSGKLFVVVSLNPDTNHARLVHNLLDNFATLTDDFACTTENK